MPTSAPLVSHRWRDVESVPIHDQRRIGQITVGKEHGALPSRLPQQGQVLGRGSHLLCGLVPHHNRPLKRALGQQLAAARRAAEIGQQQVARKTGYSRLSVAHADTGRQLLTRDFWQITNPDAPS